MSSYNNQQLFNDKEVMLNRLSRWTMATIIGCVGTLAVSFTFGVIYTMFLLLAWMGS